MQLSIIIVNYNVKHFLSQCLQSVQKAIENIDTELFVVDNCSSDGSNEMVRQNFPWVKLIANEQNVGFSCANNQAIKLATGEFILLLNPDTLVEEDTFSKCIDFMNVTPDAGAVGVKMINGNGEFLPESKRALPIPAVAFYKIFGFSKLFPRSKKFGSYHLTYLDNNETHPVEVLSGAFMFMRKNVLDEIGLLDETFFMYGEDIDLSYRVVKGNYKNYYFPQTRIIHYKGESTKTGSINYVLVFYKAMQIFAKKHFTAKKSIFLSLILTIAIWLRASVAIAKRLAQYLALPFLDILVIYAGMLVLARYWEIQVLQYRESSFPEFYYYFIIPLYIIIWVISVALNNGYKKPFSAFKANRGIIIGTVVILLIYAMLPETQRFSRAVTIFGAVWTAIAINSIRYILHSLKVKGFRFGNKNNRRVLIVGSVEETNRVSLLAQIESKNSTKTDAIFLTESTEMLENVKKNKISEVIFCTKDIKINKVISNFLILKEQGISFKIAPENSAVIIGSRNLHVPITPLNL